MNFLKKLSEQLPGWTVLGADELEHKCGATVQIGDVDIVTGTARCRVVSRAATDEVDVKVLEESINKVARNVKRVCDRALRLHEAELRAEKAAAARRETARKELSELYGDVEPCDVQTDQNHEIAYWKGAKVRWIRRSGKRYSLQLQELTRRQAAKAIAAIASTKT